MKNRTVLFFLIFVTACSSKKELTADERKAYEAEINAWHAERVGNLKRPDGWLNLTGLFWLEPGVNTFGSDAKNSIVFPSGKITGDAGYFLVKDNLVTLVAKPQAQITSNGKPVTNEIIFHPDSASSKTLTSGSLHWNIIKRETKLGIRLRDDDSKLLKTFTGVDRFAVNPDYKVEAVFKKSDSTHTISITNVLGQTTDQLSPGTLVFKLSDKEYKLDVLDGGKQFFIIFADATTGNETYSGGRFMYVNKPSPDGKIILDFNKAYNPPCVFTPYATCPLPPRQNVLTTSIAAGEKNFSLDN